MDERVKVREKPSPARPAASPPARRQGRGRGRGAALLVVLLLAAGAGAYWWTRTDTATPDRPARGSRAMQAPPQPVGFATADTGDIRIILNELGTVTPLTTVTVQTQISGYLVDVGFTEGQVVHKGDFLAQIDPRPYQVALEQAQGTLAHDTGLLEQARADLKRYQTLGRQDSIAQQQLEDQKYLVQQYTGTVQADQGTVDNARLNLAYCHIVSPTDGQVGLRLVDPGNYVSTGSTTGIAVVTRMQPISVIFSVPQQELPDIITRLRGGATLPVEAYDSANTRKLADGTLRSLDNQIDTTTGTLKLRAVFDNPDELLYPNQFVNARLLVNTMQNTVRVPVPAVQRGAPGTFVYVVEANDTVQVRPVKVGPVDGQYEAVLSGLKPGERVVTDGTDRLKDGAKVTLPAAHAAGRQGQDTAAAQGSAAPADSAGTGGPPRTHRGDRARTSGENGPGPGAQQDTQQSGRSQPNPHQPDAQGETRQ